MIFGSLYILPRKNNSEFLTPPDLPAPFQPSPEGAYSPPVPVPPAATPFPDPGRSDLDSQYKRKLCGVGLVETDPPLPS